MIIAYDKYNEIVALDSKAHKIIDKKNLNICDPNFRYSLCIFLQIFILLTIEAIHPVGIFVNNPIISSVNKYSTDTLIERNELWGCRQLFHRTN